MLQVITAGTGPGKGGDGMLGWKRTKYVASRAVRRRTYRLAEELLVEFPEYDLTQDTPDSPRTWKLSRIRASLMTSDMSQR